MSKPTYEETIKRAKTNADCGEHLSPAEVTELVLAFEAQVKQLAAERDAVVAENVALKAFGDKLSDMRNDLNGEGTGIQGRAEVACQQIALEAAMEEFDTIKTPTTDAILASLRAEGVEMAIQHLHSKFEGTGHIGVPVIALEWLSAQLRSQSEQVKGGDL